MKIVERIGVWLVGVILNWLFLRAKNHYEQSKTEKEREQINNENLKKYEEAQARADKLKAALDLLNGERSSNGL